MNKCYQCVHRNQVPGSAHSCCHALRAAAEDPNDPNVMMLETLLSIHRVYIKIGDEPAIKLNPTGVQGGWANWPLNFDPIWVEECNLFKENS